MGLGRLEEREEREKKERNTHLLGFVEADLACCHTTILKKVGPRGVYYGDIVALVACYSRQ